MSRSTYAIAIVGIGCTFPDSPGPDAFWNRILDRHNASREIPPDRWPVPLEELYDPEIGQQDRVFSRRACFIEKLPGDLSKRGLTVPEGLLDQLDPAFHLLLDAGEQAWRDAETKALDRSRCGIVLGNLALPSESTSGLVRQHLGRHLEQQAIGDACQSDIFSGDVDPINRYVAGLPAGLLAQALQVSGGHFTLDAACASSLYALKLACDRLQDGEMDAMLAGGLSRPDSLFTQMGFSQLRALSPTGTCSPFDAAGNGLVVGEGCGIVFLKRLDDALSQGDHIYGVIRGAGLSNDIGGSLLAPMSDGQLRAMRQAYTQADWDPSEVDLIECHATGTPVGDAVELDSLNQLWQEEDWRSSQCVIGSVKSNIGHLLTAAGSAALIKVLMSLKHQTLPPTANFNQAPEGTSLDESPFRILQQAEPWAPRRAGRPRRAGVSAFGFGGINAHVLVEEYLPQKSQQDHQPSLPLALARQQGEPVAIVGLCRRQGPLGEPTTGFINDHRPLQALDVEAARFRIPPRELEEMQPQQLLMLQTAADALEQSGLRIATPERAGVFMGIAFDLAAAGFHIRWTLPHAMKEWAGALTQQTLPSMPDWQSQFLAASHPPLTANRVMGALGNIVASRIAREFRLGGPSYTLSSEDTSGLHALQTAISALQNDELDLALVGAVDLPQTPWMPQPDSPVFEGACCLVLKRLDDARKDSDRIWATIDPPQMEGLGQLSPGNAFSSHSLNAGYQRGKASQAASGLWAVAQAAHALANDQWPLTEPSHFWLANTCETPRQLHVETISLDGNRGVVGLRAPSTEPKQPLQPAVPADELPFLIYATDTVGLKRRILQLAAQISDYPDLTLLQQAALWWKSHQRPAATTVQAALVAGTTEQLGHQLAYLESHLEQEPEIPLGGRERLQPEMARDSVFYTPDQTQLKGKTAFVFPGMGNPYSGMGRRLSTLLPEVFRKQQAENKRLRDQYQIDRFWDAETLDRSDQNALVIGQVAYGTAMADALNLCGIQPEASLGYSLGESTALFALRAWPERDEMLERLEKSPLFVTDLAGPVKAAGRRWGLSSETAVDWVSGVVPCSAKQVKKGLAKQEKAYLLIINTPEECVIGGERQAVQALVEDLGCHFFALEGVSAVHCEVVAEVEAPYRELHSFKTKAPKGIRFYSGASGKAYDPTRKTAADAILNQALTTVDFTRVVRQAYRDGIRYFVEIGPGNSCCRMIQQILEGKPHFARSASGPQLEEDTALVRLLAHYSTLGGTVDLSPLFTGVEIPQKTLETRVHLQRWKRPEISPLSQPPMPEVTPPLGETQPQSTPIAAPLGSAAQAPNTPVQQMSQGSSAPQLESSEATPLLQAARDRAEAHATFLRIMDSLQASMQQQLQYQQTLIQAAIQGSPLPATPVSVPPGAKTAPQSPETSQVLFTREQCMEFAIGSVAKMLGSDFAEVDHFPTRVRLPDEPLQLVDRILEIDGQPRSMSSGRVVTEHDVIADAWYLDGGCAPTCISVEAGQADLFLSGYLGIDFQHRGEAVYRLLDAVVTFHRDLPRAGETIRYDIHIDEFFRQGDTWLFRFWFDGTINGQPFITMRKGCAGFFTEAELNAGKGIVHTRLDLMEQPGKAPENWQPLLPMATESFTDAQLDALRHGDLAACYGPRFADLPLQQPLTLPGGRMKLVDRILELDPQGGRFGLGQIRGEADIRPDDWFLTCHFCDDHVMPGTLMYECCQHTMRILLMRMGWVSDSENALWQPVPGVGNQLKCRGQVIESTRKVEYRITLKEVGYRPEPYAIADALMLADGKPIVEVINLSVMLSGTTQDQLESLWATQTSKGIPAKRPIFDTDRITAFAIGNPSEAFGEPYRIFDSERRIARLPGPPFQFLDRITEIQAEPWTLEAGGTIEAQYDVPSDAWYFAANRHQTMPFCVLLETALQPCGWLAAYLGSALKSDQDLAFRNLDGHAVQLKPVTPDSGTLTTKVKITRVSSSGGMIIQSFDYEMYDKEGPVYRGDTVFGFFTRDALAQQVGLREVPDFSITESERRNGQAFPYPTQAPYSDDQLTMVDRISCYLPQGGPSELGYIEGEMDVDPEAWFFKAHFYQDPVVPGSLGLESLLQLLKVVATDRWGLSPESEFECIALNEKHQWSYRGQVIPDNRQVRVEALITACDDDRRMITADGLLHVDGKTIYRMNQFTLKLK